MLQQLQALPLYGDKAAQGQRSLLRQLRDLSRQRWGSKQASMSAARLWRMIPHLRQYYIFQELLKMWGGYQQLARLTHPGDKLAAHRDLWTPSLAGMQAQGYAPRMRWFLQRITTARSRALLHDLRHAYKWIAAGAQGAAVAPLWRVRASKTMSLWKKEATALLCAVLAAQGKDRQAAAFPQPTCVLARAWALAQRGHATKARRLLEMLPASSSRQYQWGEKYTMLKAALLAMGRKWRDLASFWQHHQSAFRRSNFRHDILYAFNDIYNKPMPPSVVRRLSAALERHLLTVDEPATGLRA